VNVEFIFRSKRWVVNCRTVNLDKKTAAELNANCLVCGEHFEDRMFMNVTDRNSLVHNAVPTVFNFPQSSAAEPRKKRKAPTLRMSISKKVKTGHDCGQAENSSLSLSSLEAIELPAVRSFELTPQKTVSPALKSLQLTPQKAALASKLKSAKVSLNRARVSLHRLRMENRNPSLKTKFSSKQLHTDVLKNKQLTCTCSLCQDFNCLPASKRQFFQSQIRACKYSKFGMRFTVQDKLLALGLFYKSPSAYRFMSSSFHLPSERTLQAFIGRFNTGCGFKTDYLEALKKRMESMTSYEKYCILTFDGMALKSKLHYFESSDVVSGFVDLNEFQEKRSDIAKQAVQFMVRGISGRWKQPVGHFFGGHSIQVSTLKEMIFKIISLLQSIGLHVVALVCDQEPSHRLLYKVLGVSETQPWFFTEGGTKVHALYDVPHLIKNLRNNLLNYNITTESGEMIASFGVIRQMYEMEKGNSLRLCPKLTDGHLELKPFKKMKVSLATQVLSHSVAVALRTYVHFQKLDDSALSTASFVERIDKIFDVLNSRVVKVNHKWKKPLTEKSVEQFQLLDEACQWITSWRFRHVLKNTVKSMLPFQQGLLLTIRGIREVVHDLLNEHAFQFVLTSRFNQDIVENWFSCIRQKGLNNDSRTTWEYESAGRAVSVNWMLGATSKSSNCEGDFDYFVGVMSNFKRQQEMITGNSGLSFAGEELQPSSSHATPSPIVTDELQPSSSHATPSPVVNEELTELMDDSFTGLTDWSMTFRLNPTDDSVVSYLAGYITTKGFKRLDCQNCHTAYELSVARSRDELSVSTEPRLAFIQNKTFDWAKHGLLAPSRELYEFTANIEKVVQMNIESLISGRKVMHNLRQCVLTCIDLASYHIDSVCESHQTQQQDYMVNLLLRVRIHHFIRIRNRELQQIDQSRKLKCNRKAKKVMNR